MVDLGRCKVLAVKEAMAMSPEAGRSQDKIGPLMSHANLSQPGTRRADSIPSHPRAKARARVRAASKERSEKERRIATTAASTGAAAMAADGKGTQRPGNPSYTGCFICGGKDHDFRRCPRRGCGGKGSVNTVTNDASAYVATSSQNVVPKQPEPQDIPVHAAAEVGHDELFGDEPEVPALCHTYVGHGFFAAPDTEAVIPDTALSLASHLYPAFAIVDSGATETVGSLEALQSWLPDDNSTTWRRSECIPV